MLSLVFCLKYYLPYNVLKIVCINNVKYVI